MATFESPGTSNPSSPKLARALGVTFKSGCCSRQISTRFRVMRSLPVEFSRRWTDVILILRFDDQVAVWIKARRFYFEVGLASNYVQFISFCWPTIRVLFCDLQWVPVKAEIIFTVSLVGISRKNIISATNL